MDATTTGSVMVVIIVGEAIATLAIGEGGEVDGCGSGGGE